MLDKSNYDLSSDDAGDSPDIRHPVETGVDDRNWNDYVEVLGALRPDLLVDEPDDNLIPPTETGIESVDDKNWNDYVRILETHSPDLLIEEPDNAAATAQDERQNLIRDDLFKKDLEGDDIILPEPDIVQNVKTEEFIPDIRPPAETSIERVDDKNWNDYVEVLEALTPDLLVEEPDNATTVMQGEPIADIKNIPKWV